VIEVEAGGMSSGSELGLQHLKLGGDDSGATNDGALGTRGIVFASEVTEVIRDEVLASTDPSSATIDPG
jgi:hypothetical protein